MYLGGLEDGFFLFSFFFYYNFFKECDWLKIHNLGLTLRMAFKFFRSVEIGLKLKVKKFWALILLFVEVTREKLIGGREILWQN